MRRAPSQASLLIRYERRRLDNPELTPECHSSGAFSPQGCSTTSRGIDLKAVQRDPGDSSEGGALPIIGRHDGRAGGAVIPAVVVGLQIAAAIAVIPTVDAIAAESDVRGVVELDVAESHPLSSRPMNPPVSPTLK